MKERKEEEAWKRKRAWEREGKKYRAQCLEFLCCVYQARGAIVWMERNNSREGNWGQWTLLGASIGSNTYKVYWCIHYTL
jgi:hypothetical protein